MHQFCLNCKCKSVFGHSASLLIGFSISYLLWFIIIDAQKAVKKQIIRFSHASSGLLIRQSLLQFLKGFLHAAKLWALKKKKKKEIQFTSCHLCFINSEPTTVKFSLASCLWTFPASFSFEALTFLTFFFLSNLKIELLQTFLKHCGWFPFSFLSARITALLII